MKAVFVSLKDGHTVNVVILAGGKFREKIGKTFHVGVIFTFSFFLHKGIWVLFLCGGNFREEDKRQIRKNYPHAKISRLTVLLCTLVDQSEC